MYVFIAMFGALALIDISLEITKIRKLMESQLNAQSGEQTP
jgi:hypothetical protein